MKGSEGRRDLFNVLHEYYPSKELQQLCVIYDFACNANEYALNREPELFKKTRWFVDNFHKSGNHKCSDIHSLRHYQFLDLPQLSTSTCESLNSFVQEFRSQFSYMKQENGMIYLIM